MLISVGYSDIDKLRLDIDQIFQPVEIRFFIAHCIMEMLAGISAELRVQLFLVMDR